LNPLLRKLESLSSLSADEKRVLTDTVLQSTRTHKPNENIILEGQQPKECCIVLEGLACQYKVLPEQRRRIIGFQVPGDIADLSGYVTGRMDHSVSTLTDATVAVIPHKVISDLTADHPAIGRALWQEAVADAAISREWLVNIGGRPAYQRIAHLLCEIDARLKRAGRGSNNTLEWPITQDEVADAMGLSAVHVSRILHQLESDNMISFNGKRITIEDLGQLQTVAEFTSNYLFIDAAEAQSVESL
jgi:CRP-like cAMP-binding protein